MTRIGYNAFEECKALTYVAFPDSVTHVGEFAFYGCEAMADADGFIILDGVLRSYLGQNVDVTIPEGVTRIGESAFSHNHNLLNVTMPFGVTRIGECAFLRCTHLTNVTVSASVESMGDFVFSECYDLTRVRYLGDCPELDYSLGTATIYSSSTGVETCVPADAAGWTDALVNGRWQGYPIRMDGPGCLVMTAEEVNGGGRMKVTVRRVGSSDGRIAAKLKTQDASTVNGVTGRFGVDFEYMKEILVWNDGDGGEKEVYVQTYATDATVPTTFRLKLSAQTTGDYADCATPTLADGGKVIATINPAQKGTISFAAPDPMSVIAGEPLRVKIRRTGGSDGRVAVKFKTQDASTVGGINGRFGIDFQYVKTTLVWAHGDTSEKTVEVPTVAAWWTGGPKTFRLKLSVMTTGDYEGWATPALASGGKVIASILPNEAAHPGEVFVKKVESVRGGAVVGGPVAAAPFWGYAGATLRVTIGRSGGDFGRIAVKAKTQDASTVGGINGLFATDFTYAKETFVWEDGDAADKTLEIPTFHVAGATYPRTFRLKLSAMTTGDYEGCATPELPAAKVIVSLTE